MFILPGSCVRAGSSASSFTPIVLECIEQEHYAASFPLILSAYSLGESPGMGIP
jgi:hypothetical protein